MNSFLVEEKDDILSDPTDQLLEDDLVQKEDARKSYGRRMTGFEDKNHFECYPADKEFMKDKITLQENLLCNSEEVTPSIYNRPSNALFPRLPTDQVFTAMLMHIDSNAAIWVIPHIQLDTFCGIAAELESCSDPVQEISPGMLMVAKLRGVNVRGRVLEEDEEGLVRLVDVDSGEVFLSATQDLCRVCPSLLYRPPLAIPR